MQLMSIGRFSRLTGLGIKALRHYDEVGLLVPAAVDGDTGYRLYSAGQVAQAEAIGRLRRLDMPLDEIRTALAADGPEALREVLLVHQRRLASRDASMRASLGGLQELIDGRETLMGMRSEALDAEEHRRHGIDLYNRTWTLMESPGDEMLHCAHASAYHWLQAGGTAANRARSEWLCSRVYALLGRAEPSLHHARRCLHFVESSPGEMEEWDLPAAYEALARAHAVAGDAAETERYRALGLDAIAKVADEEDRAPIESDLAGIGL